MSLRVPAAPVRALRAMAATADQAATQAAMEVFAHGGNAVDAAIGANAAIAVTAPAPVRSRRRPLRPRANARRRRPRAQRRRAAPARAPTPPRCAPTGHRVMPMRHDIRTATVPGCVDGWAALHERFGPLDLASVAGPRRAARRVRLPGQPAARRARSACSTTRPPSASASSSSRPPAPAPGCADPASRCTLRAIAAGGREAFYGGAFGEGLLALGDGWFTEGDLATPQADWVEPLRPDAFGVELDTIGPNSQGYLFLGAARLADARRAARRPRRRRVGPRPRRGRGDGRVRPARRPPRRAPTARALLDAIDGRVDLLDLERAGRRPVAANRRRHDVPVHRRRHRAGASA